MTYCSRLIAAGLVLAGLVGLAAPARAQNNPYTWNTTDGNWNLAANWLDGLNAPAVPPSGDTTALAFNASGTTSYTATNDVGTGTFTLNRLTVNNTGSGTVTIAGATTANTLTFAGTAPTIDVTAGSVLFTGLLAGSPTVTKTGAGTFVHDSNNSGFTGTLIVDGGIFVNQATVNAVTNFNPVSIVVNNGGTYQFGNAAAGDPSLPNATYITVNTGGTVNWQEGEVLGGFHLQGGTINLQQGGVTSSGTTAQQSWTSGTLTGGAFNVGGNTAINKTTSGTVTISGNAGVTTGSGGFNILDGTVVHVNAANLGTANVTLGNTGGTTAGTFEYQGATATRGGAFSLNAGGGTIRVTTAATTLTLSGAVSGAGPLTKEGAGTLALTGALNQTGTTTVAAGTLRLNPVASAGGFSVSNGATLAVASGVGTASLTVPTLSLVAGGSTVQFDLNTASLPTVPLLAVSSPDGLNPNGGTSTLRVTNQQAFAVGTYTLIDYSGAGIASGFNLSLPGRTAGSLVYDTANTRIDLTVTGSDSVKWTGAANGNWDVGSAPGVGGTNNWQLVAGGTATNFIDTDTVLFDDTAAGFTVNLAAAVQPAAVIVNNSTNNYTIQGTGSITGPTALTKQGTGSLVLATDNTYAGGTTVSAGTLVYAGNPVTTTTTAGFPTGAVTSSPVGSGAVNLGSGATLAIDGTNRAMRNDLLLGGSAGSPSVVSVPTGSEFTLTGNTAGGATVVTKTGGGLWRMTGDSTFIGTLTIDGGTVLLTDFSDGGVGGDFDASAIVINNGAKFQFATATPFAGENPDLPAGTVVTINAGGVAEWHVGEDYGGIALRGGAYNTRVNHNLGQTSVLESGTIGGVGGAFGSLAGAGLIQKTTDGTVTITGVALNNTGGLAIDQGVLSTDGPIATGAGGAADVLTIGTTGAATLQYRGATAAVGKPITLGEGGGVIDVTQAGTTYTFSGVVSGNAISKAGPGTLALTGTNTYAGTTTVSAGTLLMNGNQSAATGAVGVTGGVLGGRGTIGGAVTVSPGGKVLAGQGAAVNEQLTLGSSLTLGNTAAIRAVIGNGTTGTDTTLATGSSQLAVAGAFGRSSASDRITIELAPDGSTFDLSGGTTYTRRVVSGYGSLSNLNAQTYLAADNAFAVTGVGFDIANWSVIVGQGGNTVDVMFTPVPEPATGLGLAAVGLGAAGLVRRLRRVRGHGTDGQSPA